MFINAQGNWNHIVSLILIIITGLVLLQGTHPTLGRAQTLPQAQLEQLPQDVRQRLQEQTGSRDQSTLPELSQSETTAQDDETARAQAANDTTANDSEPNTKRSTNASLSKIERIYNSNYRDAPLVPVRSTPLNATSQTHSVPTSQDSTLRNSNYRDAPLVPVRSTPLNATSQTRSVPTSQDSTLRQFGYNLFHSYAEQVPTHIVPDPAYTLGTGDVLRVRIWGSGADSEFTARIRPDGTASLPKIGVVSIAGTQLGEIDKVLEKEFDKYIQGINLDVSLEKLHSIEVYVVGAVKKPGLHMVPAFSTALHGLMAAQGVAKTGSLRRITVLRDGEQHRIDLYELLLEGQKPDTNVLQDRDVIFVPRIGPTAAVRGGVVQAGIFELQDETTVGQLLDLAGGLLPQGYAQRIHQYRYADNARAEILEAGTAANSTQWRSKAVQSGDLIDVRTMGPQTDRTQAVRLQGHVVRPDIFAFSKGMTLADVLSSADQLQPGAITDFGLLFRYDADSARYSVKRFPLAALLQDGFDIALQPRDRIVVLSRQEKGIRETLRIAGAVWQSGEYEYHPGMQVTDLISLAGGTKFGAQPGLIEVSRQYIEDGATKTKHVQLDNTAQREQFTLQPFDYVFVPQAKDAQQIKTVDISGEVRFPGTYRIKDGEQISDLIRRAGGFTEQAYFFGAKFTSPKAQKIQQQSVDQLVRELEVRTYQQMSEQTQTAISEEEATLAQQTKSNLQGFIDKLDSLEVEGRVAITMANLETFSDSRYDFELDDGDTLNIPKRPNFVAVTGSVYSPSAYLYQPGQTAADYLDKAGGATKTADEDYMYILRANGEVISKQQGGTFANPFASTELMPGDTVVVPENLDRVPYLRLVRDVSDIVFKIATTAGVALSLM